MSNFYKHESAIIDEGAVIGDNSKIWHFSHVMKAIIGNNCILGQNVFVGNDVRIGKNVKIQNNVSLYEGVICEDDVFIGPSVAFTNVVNPRSFIERKSEYKKTYLKKGVTIGANATLICGITIGEYAFIGAGCVVTKDVKSYALLKGNPARQDGWMSEAGSKLNFNDGSTAVCSLTQQVYILENNRVVKKDNPGL
ncbi:MAG TPA: acyltransferase [Chitinophagales bacterium]|nr:acyltransferase [Chitinophagales bacterium]